MTELDPATIPRVVLVFNGPLKLSPGKMAAQAFQACQRLHKAALAELQDNGGLLGPIGLGPRGEAVTLWEKHTTTIARVAKTTKMFERVCAEVPGVVMIDEGFTEVEPDTATVFASWPAVRAEEHKLLSNAKVTLLRDSIEPFAAWSDEQIRVVARALEAAADEGEEIQGTDAGKTISDALRAVAASRHLSLPAPYGRGEQSPENWLT